MRTAILSTGFQKFAGVGLGLLATLFLTNVMMAEEFGYYVYVLGFVTLISLLAQIGLPQLVLRETIRSLETGDDIATRSITRWGYVAISLAAAIAALGLAAYSHWALEDNVASLVILALPIIFLTGWNATRASILRAYGWVTRSQLPQNIIKPASLLVIAIGVLWLSSEERLSADQAILANVFAGALAFIVGYAFLRNMPRLNKGPRNYQNKLWFTATLALGLSGSMRAISANFNVVLLGSFGLIEEAGVFRVAFLIGSQVGIALQVANIVISKGVGAAIERDDMRAAERLLRRSSFLTTSIAGAMVLALAAIGALLLDVGFPPAYAAAYWPMLIIALAHFCDSMAGSVALLLNLSRKEWSVTFALTVSTTVNIVANLVLIPMYGVVGAAVASLLSIMVWNLILFRSTSKRLGMHVGFFSGAVDYFLHSRQPR